MSGFEKISKMNLADLDRPNTAGEAEEATAAETQAEQPKAEEPQKMAEPVGEHYYFDAEFTEKDLITFLFSHYYRQPLVILATIFAVV